MVSATAIGCRGRYPQGTRGRVFEVGAIIAQVGCTVNVATFGLRLAQRLPFGENPGQVWSAGKRWEAGRKEISKGVFAWRRSGLRLDQLVIKIFLLILNKEAPVNQLKKFLGSAGVVLLCVVGGLSLASCGGGSSSSGGGSSGFSVGVQGF